MRRPRRRPTNFPTVGAPLAETTCTCSVADPIRIGRVRRCRKCAGIVEAQGLLGAFERERKR